jgi:hypothetical protein
MLNLILWFYYGFFSIGGWVFFLFLAMGVAAWIWYDSLNRNLKLWGWRFAASALWLLLIPAMLFRFTVPQGTPTTLGTGYITCVLSPAVIPPGIPPKVFCLPTLLGGDYPLAGYFDTIFYLGLICGLLSMLLAVAYYVQTRTTQMRPAPSRGMPAYYPPPSAAGQYRREPVAPPARMRPAKPAAAAWLVSRDGRNYQLCASETTIGRSPENDIYLDGDTTVSKNHAKITEQNGHFRLVDLGSTNGTRLNGKAVRSAVLLQPNDEIQFGDHTFLRFLTGR